MSYLISQIISVIKLLHSENGAKQIAAGLTLGFLLGFSPVVSLQGMMIITLIILLRVQIGAALAMAAITKFIAILMISPLSQVGVIILSLSSLKPFFTTLYNIPLFPLTKFNHSVVMGGFIFSIIFGPLIFLGFHWAIKKYQESMVEKIRKSKLWRAIQASTLYQWYVKYSALTR